MMLALLASFPMLCAQAQAPAHDYAKAWATVRQAIETRYYDRQKRHEEMEKLLDAAAPEAKDAKTDAEFEDAVNQMIDAFHDSHFQFYTRADQTFYVMDGLANPEKPAAMPYFGAYFGEQESGGWRVKMLLEDTSAAKAGLRVGDIVTQAEGKPFSPVDSITADDGKSVALTVLRGGQTLKMKVDVSEEPMLQAFLDASRDSERKVGPDGAFAYIHLWTLANDSFRTLLSGAVSGKFADTKGFILDLRDGFGGRPEGFADPFFRPGDTIDWEYGNFTAHEAFGYDKALVVLINHGSRSAKEVLSYILQHSKRAVLIGTTTAGNVLGTFPQSVQGWAYLEIPMVDLTVDGVRLEGRGASPDITVEPEFDSDGHDLVLQRAVEYLEAHTGGHKPPGG